MLRFRTVLSGDVEGIAATRQMFEEYKAELGIDLCFQSFQEELDSLPGKYGPPQGVLYLVYWDEDLAACGALRPLEPEVCEIKRIYVRPAFRRRGIAEDLSRRLFEDAEERGYSLVKLDTLARLGGAVRMYEKLGFTRTTPYNFNPEADIVYFQRKIHGNQFPNDRA